MVGNERRILGAGARAWTQRHPGVAAALAVLFVATAFAVVPATVDATVEADGYGDIEGFIVRPVPDGYDSVHGEPACQLQTLLYRRSGGGDLSMVTSRTSFFSTGTASAFYSFNFVSEDDYVVEVNDRGECGAVGEFWNDVTDPADATVIGVTSGSEHFPYSILTSGGPDCDEGGDGPFSEVAAGSAFCDDIAWLAQTEITTGRADGSFGAQLPVKRQAMAAFVYRLARNSGYPVAPPCEEAPFTDVGTAHPFCREIQWMADNGISTGYADGSFGADDVVKRQAMAAFLYRFAVLDGRTGGPIPVGPCVVAPFTDVPTSNPFCEEIRWMSFTGITNGYGDGRFGPQDDVKRRAMASFLRRIWEIPKEPT